MPEPFDYDEYAARVRRHLLSAPTFGHQPMTRDEARAEYLRMLAKLDGVEVPRLLVQPDDPGVYARSCLRCGLDEGLGANRLCALCCPPAPWWAHMLRWLPCVARRWL